MDAKQKAKDLIVKYKNTLPRMDYHSLMLMAGECSLLAVDEVLENLKEWDFGNDNGEHHIWFWRSVKMEINKQINEP